MDATIRISQDARADAILSKNAFALLIGMTLDQQFPMERAFAGPAKILERFGSLDPLAIAATDTEGFEELCATPPAVHRYGRSMARRIQQLARVVMEEYKGDAELLWTTADSTEELLRRLKALPGFGDQKARIFAALLGKQLGVRHDGWRETIGDYAQEGSTRSVADVTDPETLQAVREFKKAAKAEAKAKSAK